MNTNVSDRFLTPPRFASPDFPFQVQATINRDNSRITLTIDTPEGWARHLLDALELLTSLGDLMRRRFDQAKVLNRAQDTLARVQLENRLLGEAYLSALKTGKPHRQAVQVVFDDPRFRAIRVNGWTKTDFGRAIRDVLPDLTERPT